MFPRRRGSPTTKYDIDKRRSLRSTKKNVTRSERVKEYREKRRRRHVGPHDEGGLQRLISTGNVLLCLFTLHIVTYRHTGLSSCDLRFVFIAAL